MSIAKDTSPAEPKRKAAKSAPVKRQRLSAADRKSQILVAARKVFIEHGLSGTRTKDLAKEAGVNEATLFLYFKTKEEIFDEAITEPLKKLIDLQMKEGADFQKARSKKQKLDVATLAHAEIFSSMEDFAPLLIAGVFSSKGKGEEIYRKLIVPALDSLTESAKVGFDTDDDFRAKMIVLTSLGVGFAYAIHNRYTDDVIDKERAVEFFSNLIVNA